MEIPVKSLSFKISFFVVAAMLVSLLIFSLVFIFSERSKLLKDLVRNGEVFANFSARTIYDNYVQYYTHPRPEDFSQFQDRVSAVLSNNQDVSNVSLVAINGRILFDSAEFQTGKYVGGNRTVSSQKTLDLVKGDKTGYASITQNDQDFTEIVVPIYQAEGHLFSVRYLLSRESLSTRMNEVYYQIVLVVVPLIVLVILVAVPFTTRLIRPITDLTAAAEKIRGGNFDVKTTIKTKDELGQLAATFNEMSEKLKESYGILEAKVRERTLALEKERKGLEQRVKERTAELEKLKTDLEQTVADRTKTLEQKLAELAQANKYMIGRELRMAELKEENEGLRQKISVN